jgi:hypothetical protein
MALDLAVARAIFQTRQIERAVNDPGPWTIAHGDQVSPAVRWVGEDRVIFRAHLSEVCWITPPDPILTLLCRGEVVGIRPIDLPDEDEYVVEWSFALPERVSV